MLLLARDQAWHCYCLAWPSNRLVLASQSGIQDVASRAESAQIRSGLPVLLFQLVSARRFHGVLIRRWHRGVQSFAVWPVHQDAGEQASQGLACELAELSRCVPLSRYKGVHQFSALARCQV